jgi:hypothetical protein
MMTGNFNFICILFQLFHNCVFHRITSPYCQGFRQISTGIPGILRNTLGIPIFVPWL